MKVFELFFIIATLNFISCGFGESEARMKCHLSQTGKYLFDSKKNTMYNSIIDSIKLSELIMVFNSDSTFHTNIQAPFLDDTIGSWDAGHCGFESAGEMHFKNTPHVIGFAPCRENDSMFAVFGINEGGGGPKYYWFKKLQQ